MKKFTHTVFCSIILLGLSLSAFSQALITDTNYGDNGFAYSPQLNNSTANVTFGLSNIFRQPDDKILVCGYSYNGGNNYYNIMYRVDCNGNADSSFDGNGILAHRFDQKSKAYSYALLPDGKIVVVGQQSASLSLADQTPFIARYKSDGAPDSTFGNNGVSPQFGMIPREFLSVYAVAGDKYLATNGLTLMRFNNNGDADLTFGTNGIVTIPTPTDFTEPASTVLQPAYKSVMRGDGKIITTAPSFFQPFFSYFTSFICYNQQGELDNTFGVNGFFKDNSWECPAAPAQLILQSDDKVVAVREYGFLDKIVVKRIKTNGTIDSTFGNNGQLDIVAAAPPIALVYTSKFNDDSFIIGYTENDGQPVKFKKFNTNGTPDLNFSLNGGNTFQFGANNDSEYPELGITSANEELIMAGMFAPDINCRASITRFVVTTATPSITQDGNTLYSNVNNSGAGFQWLLNGNVLNGETNSTLTITQPGTYSVIVTNSWGCDVSDEFVVTTVGIQVPENKSGVVLFPSPAGNTLNIRNSFDKPRTYQVFDITGKLILTQTLNTTHVSMDVSILPSGMYVLQIVSEDQLTQQKFIKQ